MTLQARVEAQSAEISALKQRLTAIRELRDSILRDIPPDDSAPTFPTDLFWKKLSDIALTSESLKRKQAAGLASFRDAIAEIRSEVSSEIARIIALADAISASPGAAAPPLAGLSFPFSAAAPLRGVIAGLTELGGAGALSPDLAEVIASGCFDESRFPPRFVADLTAANVFVSANEPMQWVGYHFRQGRLRFRDYALRSRFDGWVNSNNPKSWVIEVSEDGEEWRIVDERRGNADLNATDVTKTFQMKEDGEGPYVRVRQVEPAHSGKNFLALSAFELFGTFVE